jgi:hypothetical protein
MILEHSNPYPVYNKHKELLQSGNVREIQHTVLVLSIGLLFYGQLDNTSKVTHQFYSKKKAVGETQT